MHFCRFFADRRLSTRRSMKGAVHCPFRGALWNNYFEKVLMIKFISNWNDLLKHYIFVDSLLMLNYVQGALRNKLRIAPFIKQFKTTTLVQGTLQKELHIAPFIERFKTTTLVKSSWWILSGPRKIYLSIAFLLNLSLLIVSYI